MGRKVLSNATGQSTIEYVLIAAALVTVAVVVAGILGPKVKNVGTAAGGRIDAAATSLTTITVEKK